MDSITLKSLKDIIDPFRFKQVFFVFLFVFCFFAGLAAGFAVFTTATLQGKKTVKKQKMELKNRNIPLVQISAQNVDTGQNLTSTTSASMLTT